MASETTLLRSLGKRIRELRKASGISQERLAELADIHENHVRRIEGGTANPSYLVLLRIARALDVSPSELIEGR
jgi:transcriptional regulator with XRE-family HTH domain